LLYDYFFINTKVNSYFLIYTQDENEDGLFSIEELLKWLETSKQVKLVKEGRDAEVDKIFSAKSDTMKQKKEENNISGTGISD